MEDGRTYLGSAVCYPVVGVDECLNSATSRFLTPFFENLYPPVWRIRLPPLPLMKVWLVHSSSGWLFMLGPIMDAGRLGGGHCQS